MRELAKPPSLADKALVLGMFVGPLVVGIAVPFGVAALVGMGAAGPLPVFLLPVGLYLLVFAGLLGGFSRARRNELADVPVGDVASREDGELVLVQGRVTALSDDLATGELTGKRWLWTELSLVTKKHGMRGPVTDTFESRARFVPFAIDDGGETIAVDATGGLLRAAPHVSEANLPGGGAPRVRALLANEGLGEPEAGATAIESALAEGDEVVVLGVVRRGDAYRAGVSLGSGPQDQLVVTGEKRDELVAPNRPPRGMAAAGLLITLTAIALMFLPQS